MEVADLDTAEQGWVKVMGDYMATGLFSKRNVPLEYDEIPLSPSLQERLQKWSAWYDQNDDYLEEKFRAKPGFDYVGFAHEGLAIAKALKAELPHWTVVYFDESQARDRKLSSPRETYEYAVEA